MEVQTAIDWHLIQSVLISLALGAIVGLERQSHKTPDMIFGSLGVRTFALSSLLGTLSVIAQDVSPAMPYVMGAGYIVLILAFFWHERHAIEQAVGITTQVAALTVFVLGVLVPSQPLFAVGMSVVVATILSTKQFTHRFVGLLSAHEIVATMKFLLVTVVVLPLLPNQPVDPWGIYNPRELWLLVVLISGISFLGYFAIRFMGASRGLVWTGVLGGLASSTAVTLAMSRQVNKSPDSKPVLLAAAFAVLLANAFMFLRVTVAVGAVNLKLVETLWIPFVIMAIPGCIVAGGMWFYIRRYQQINNALHNATDPTDTVNTAVQDKDDLELQNPFELVPAFKFALLLVVIIGVAHFLQSFFGTTATYVAALFGGIAETNAISLALARMEYTGQIDTSTATRAIVVAILANSFVKAGLSAVVGTRKLATYVVLGLTPILLAGLVAITVI